MASKTIMIQEKTYNKLLKLKKNNESFNDIIERLLEQQQDLTSFFGILTEEEGNRIEQAIEELSQLNDESDKERNEMIEE